MMLRTLAVSLAGALVASSALTPAPASAQVGLAACIPGASTLPAELAGWVSHRPLAAATQASRLREAGLMMGEGVDAMLASSPDVRYIVTPEKPGGSVSYGGLFTFAVEQAGTYRVALGAAAWIDVLRHDKAIASIAHGHGPECTDIRKMVDFPLTPGRYTLQIAANGAAVLPLLVVRLP
ncbi:homogentisate 1,2-dioxygenase [Novosphingobium sp.]|uniref:homogentisate 1,2-dioxygenase n=1 Tax=Novosphingobium sp. TaxID=1874826 RepID=UPI002B49E008|nr:homogentisate 1,2-dioxygenase [Novosphingobium sp.]HKR93323.1 homogentisate 1,2-dioxygenase [Novosphingobium sp.]